MKDKKLFPDAQAPVIPKKTTTNPEIKNSHPPTKAVFNESERDKDIRGSQAAKEALRCYSFPRPLPDATDVRNLPPKIGSVEDLEYRMWVDYFADVLLEVKEKIKNQ